MNQSPGRAPLGPDEAEVRVLGRVLRVACRAGEPELAQAISLLERTFQDMERAHAVKWGSPPASMDTSTWMLMGALNLAHRVVRAEQDASRQTRDLEQTLSQLLDDVSDLPSAPGPLFQGVDGDSGGIEP